MNSQNSAIKFENMMRLGMKIKQACFVLLSPLAIFAKKERNV